MDYWFKTHNKPILLQKTDEATSDCNCRQVIPFFFLPSSTKSTTVKQNAWKTLSFLTCLSSVFPCSACSLSNHQLPQMFVPQFCWLRQQTAHSIISWWIKKPKKVFCILKAPKNCFHCLGFYITKYSVSPQLIPEYLRKQRRRINIPF